MLAPQINLKRTSDNAAITRALKHKLTELGFTVTCETNNESSYGFEFTASSNATAGPDDPDSLLKQADNQVQSLLEKLPIDFEKLPLFFEGESKILRCLTEKVVAQKFKPTVYSFTQNRYGTVLGTDKVRAEFTAKIFTLFHQRFQGKYQSAFIGILQTGEGPLIIQKIVDASNLEVRVKRYHIGSPLHRYRYTEKYSSTQAHGVIHRWSRFESPVVCFDWRNPLIDDCGNRLADEPLSDDYAEVWMHHVTDAKTLAKETFLWLEDLFMRAGLILVDICFLIDKSGKVLYGEISPDCLRVRDANHIDINNAESFDKDIWRNGQSSSLLLERYNSINDMLFNPQKHSPK